MSSKKICNSIAIDYSTKNIALYGELNGIEFTKIITRDEKNKILYKIADELHSILQLHDIDFFIIEGYAFKGSRVTQMAEVKGAMLSVIERFDIPIVSVYPKTWKTKIIETTKYKKSTKTGEQFQLKKVADKYGKVFFNIDLCDAFCMWKTIEELTPNEKTTTLKKLYERKKNVCKS